MRKKCVKTSCSFQYLFTVLENAVYVILQDLAPELHRSV